MTRPGTRTRLRRRSCRACRINILTPRTTRRLYRRWAGPPNVDPRRHLRLRHGLGTSHVAFRPAGSGADLATPSCSAPHRFDQRPGLEARHAAYRGDACSTTSAARSSCRGARITAHHVGRPVPRDLPVRHSGADGLVLAIIVMFIVRGRDRCRHRRPHWHCRRRRRRRGPAPPGRSARTSARR